MEIARADEIRDDLLESGIVLEDSAQGTTWHRSDFFLVSRNVRPGDIFIDSHIAKET